MEREQKITLGVCWIGQSGVRDNVGMTSRKHSTKRESGLNLPLLPVCMQSTPNRELFSFAWRDLMLARVSIGLKPEFSARAMGTQSRASEKARMAYCSRPGH